MLLLLFTFVSFLVTLIILPFILNMIIKAGLVRPNFKKEQIPLGVGLVFFVSAALSSFTVFMISPQMVYDLLTLLFAIATMALLGLIDDLLGTGETRGLKGHFKKLFLKKELTTGALKALMGGFTAVIITLTIIPLSLDLKFIGLLILYTLIIALSTNLINLLDLRPGRAGKGFLLFASLLIIFGFSTEQLPLLGLILGGLLAYLPKDLSAGAMMGDTGSNLLGVSLGIFSVWVLSFKLQVILLIILLLIHVITEKYSLTKIIESNRILRYLDMLGRDMP